MACLWAVTRRFFSPRNSMKRCLAHLRARSAIVQYYKTQRFVKSMLGEMGKRRSREAGRISVVRPTTDPVVSSAGPNLPYRRFPIGSAPLFHTVRGQLEPGGLEALRYSPD